MPTNLKYPKRISDISERDFWSSMTLDFPAGVYARLGEYHRQRLAGELAARRGRMLVDPPTNGQTAEDLLRHRIVTWHTTVVDFGPEIDWNFAGTDMYGFHYLGWLAAGTRRLLETGDAAYRDCLIDIVTSYYRARNELQHPIPGLHLVYYELGAWAKTTVLLPLYLALLETGGLPAETHAAFMKLFLGFARSLYDMQTGYHPGNWQIVGCSGLLTLARVFPEFTEAPAWEARALQYLTQHLTDDFFADGGHKERCWGYGFMSLRGITDAFQVAERHGGLGADARLFRQCIRRSFRWFAQTLGPTEHAPAFGDDALGSGSAYLDAAQPFFPGAGRDLGVDRAQSCVLKPSGYAILRNGAAPDATYANISFGRYAGWHSHMDCLSLNLWAYGKPLLEELGRFGGYGEGLTILFRAAESHNQLTLDGMHYDNSAEYDPTVQVAGAGWHGHPAFVHRAGHDPVWQSTPEVDFFTAYHTAYRANWREPQHVDACVRRTVLFVKDPGYLLVSDVAWEPASNGEGPNFAVTQHWHSPLPFQTSAGLARTVGDPACLLAFVPQPALRRLETGTDYTAEESGGEYEYPERHYLRARRWMPVEHRGATGVSVVLYPFRGDPPALTVETLPLDNAPLFRALAVAVTTPRGRDVIVFNPERLKGVTFAGKAVKERWMLRREGD